MEHDRLLAHRVVSLQCINSSPIWEKADINWQLPRHQAYEYTP